MRRLLAGAVTLMLLASPLVSSVGAAGPGASPGDSFFVDGQVRDLDVKQRRVVLSNGTELWATDARALNDLREGMQVRAFYEERGGQKLIKRWEPKAP